MDPSHNRRRERTTHTHTRTAVHPAGRSFNVQIFSLLLSPSQSRVICSCLCTLFLSCRPLSISQIWMYICFLSLRFGIED
ncbi:hypothetical protein L6452_14188 [Arctium lappa]|uniref:Uncharacterized protein n=1 Tax=Arctium lappa TaxID=4217 RepID=A0ACB9CKD6_ARCLA|nr:hypothetical protein L6452_14188 [Arctium lappa]